MRKTGEICKLSELETGQVATVLKLNEKNKKVRRHLLDMGIIKGTHITIKKIAPMGDPIDISFRDNELCICKENLKKIEVEVLI